MVHDIQRYVGPPLLELFREIGTQPGLEPSRDAGGLDAFRHEGQAMNREDIGDPQGPACQPMRPAGFGQWAVNCWGPVS